MESGNFAREKTSWAMRTLELVFCKIENGRSPELSRSAHFSRSCRYICFVRFTLFATYTTRSSHD
eukprot:3311397-Lingulodinium_polyedra.AAC.1